MNNLFKVCLKITHADGRWPCEQMNAWNIYIVTLNFSCTLLTSNIKYHGFTCNLKKDTLVSFSKTSNCTFANCTFANCTFANCTRNHTITYTNNTLKPCIQYFVSNPNILKHCQILYTGYMLNMISETFRFTFTANVTTHGCKLPIHCST